MFIYNVKLIEFHQVNVAFILINQKAFRILLHEKITYLVPS